MKFAKLIIILTVVLFVLLFIVQNVGQQVDVKFFSDNNSVTTDMIIILFISMLFGLILGYLYSGIQILSAKNTIRVLKKKYEKMQKEINLLRNKEISNTDEQIKE